MRLWPNILAYKSCLLHLALGQFPPTPSGVTVIKSKFHHDVELTYKEPGICETTPGVGSYSGYVHFPPDTLNESQNYPINTFFWFFEARTDPRHAPLAIWLNGGPGGSSMTGALAENGPCFVDNDSNSTYLNPWSWNNEVNVLYIDQPNQVGFSYDTLTNVTSQLIDDGYRVQPADFSEGVPEQNLTFLVGTTSSQKSSHTANTTAQAANALWHFTQIWLEEFPHYKSANKQINLFAESYGGHYSPSFVAHFIRQNERIKNGSLSGPGLHYLHLNTLGLVNGCIDAEAQARSWASFTRHNTYGLHLFNESQYYKAMYDLTRPNGVIDLVQECQRLRRELDPNDHGDIEEVNSYCRWARSGIRNSTTGPFKQAAQHGWLDITYPAQNPFPSPYHTGFLNQHWVQAALGVPINFTAFSSLVEHAFLSTGDEMRGRQVDDLAYILDHGVRVAMMYGDRDYACNWVGGEETSLKIPHAYQEDFAKTGYTPLVLSPVWSAGLVRQFGNLSFTRVYQAGHMLPSYQPEAAYEIFMRAVMGRDIATGTLDLDEVDTGDEQYGTKGPRDTWWMQSDLLPSPAPECYVLDVSRCSQEQKSWIRDGTAVVKDWIVVGREEQTSHSQYGFWEQMPLSI